MTSYEKTWWSISGDNNKRAKKFSRGLNLCAPRADGHSMLGNAAVRQAPAASDMRRERSDVARDTGRALNASHPSRRAGFAEFACTIFAVCLLSAPAVTLGQPCFPNPCPMAAPAERRVRTLVGCSPKFSMQPELKIQSFDASLVWARVDINVGLPRNGEQACGGSSSRAIEGTGLQVCGGTMFNITMRPEPSQAGQIFTTRVIWEYALDGTKKPQRIVGVPGAGNIRQAVSGVAKFEVVRPKPTFITDPDELSRGTNGSYVFTLGCMGRARIFAKDMNLPVNASAGCNGPTYPLVVNPIAAGSYPSSSNGLPEPVPSAEGGVTGVPSFVALEDDVPSSRKLEFQWVPERGQERSAPYRICFEAVDTYGLERVVKCITVKVQKCAYCTRQGETLVSLAAMYDTDWLHLYTSNPLITNPDLLPVGTRINTGVIYEVRKGDYLELLYDRFFVSEEQLLGVNPDVRKGQELVEGEELCVIPPVCKVECKHGLDCTPLQA